MSRSIIRPSRQALASWLLPAVLLAVIAVMALVEPRFFNRLNLMNIARNFAISGMLAMAQALVMIVGGFDLSVGAVMALASVLGVSVMVAALAAFPDLAGLAVTMGILAGLSGGLAVGALNGTLVATLRVSPFIVTLGVASSLLGAVLYVTKGVPIYGVPDLLIKGIGRGLIAGLPVLLWVAAGVALILSLIMNHMAVGRHIYAVGGAPRAAHASGIAARRITVLVYAAGGLLAALAGLMVTARIGSGQSTIGTSAAIESIAAAVIAGVSLRGGKGSMARVLLAALLLTVIANALNLAQIDSKFQTLVLGVFLIGAIATERLLEGRSDDE